jgi:hypothetical protein
MAIKKFNEWCNEFNENAMNSLGQVGTYASRAAEAGAKKNYNLKNVQDALTIFLSQFKHPSEQTILVKMLKNSLKNPRTMFNTGNQQAPTVNQQAPTGNQQAPTGNQQVNTGNQQVNTGNQMPFRGQPNMFNNGNQATA